MKKLTQKDKARRVIKKLNKLKQSVSPEDVAISMAVKLNYNSAINEAIGLIIREFNL